MHLEVKYRGDKMTLNKDDDIQIKLILMSKTDEPRFVEFFAPLESRNHIINADRFCEVYGYTIADLKEIHYGTFNK